MTHGFCVSLPTIVWNLSPVVVVSVCPGLALVLCLTCIRLIWKATEKAGYLDKVEVGLDVASSEFKVKPLNATLSL